MNRLRISIREIRRENLRLLVSTMGSNRQSEFAELINKPPSLISQIINGIRGMGERLAREIEESIYLPRFSLDTSMASQSLEDQQMADSERLKRAWTSFKARTGVSQSDATELLGIQQSAISQYLNGKIKLNLPILLKWSAWMEVPPESISPTLCKHLALSSSTSRASNECATGPAIPYLPPNTSPRSQAVLIRLAKAHADGRLTEDDLMALEQIALRIMKNQSRAN